MATEHHHQPQHPHGDDGTGQLNHETTDISLDNVGKLAIGFVLVLCTISAVIFVSYRMLDRRSVAVGTAAERAADRNRAAAKALTIPDLMERPNAIDEGGRAAAGPKLLTNEPLWLAGIKTEKHQVLTSYAWIDKEAGTVRLPIARAKQLIIERGLPSTAAAEGTTAPAADPGGTEPTGSGAGPASD